MSFWRDFQRYNNYKLFRMFDKIIEERIKEKHIKKAKKKNYKNYIVNKYGYNYYLKEKRWNSIKDQLKNETFEAWEKRVKIFGFSLDGVDLKTNEQHLTKALTNTGKVYHKINIVTYENKSINNEENDIKMNKQKLPNTADFKKYIENEINNISGDYIILNAGEVHDKLGGGKNNNGRQPSCCHAMMYYYKEGYDEILQNVPSGQGRTLTIKYYKR